MERLKYITLCEHLRWQPSRATFQWAQLAGLAHRSPGGCIVGFHDPQWMPNDKILQQVTLLFALQVASFETETLCWIQPHQLWLVRFHPDSMPLAPRLILQAALLSCLSTQFLHATDPVSRAHSKRKGTYYEIA